jgi:hypothetical protein
MLKQLRMATMVSMLAFTTMAGAAQSAFPLSEFWSERMFLVMDSNKDGMVSRDEYLAYMGKQYDMMDGGKKGMLTKSQFMDKKMMASTFPLAGERY